MSKEVIAILQNSLNENERVKQRQLVAFAALFLSTLAVLLWIGHLASNPATDLREMLVWAVIAMVVIITYGVLGLALYINRTTERLLRTLKSVSEKS
jgi:hypothetical protein